jgi:hypothetical protein
LTNAGGKPPISGSIGGSIRRHHDVTGLYPGDATSFPFRGYPSGHALLQATRRVRGATMIVSLFRVQARSEDSAREISW